MEDVDPRFLPIRFGIFELDLRSGELTKQGRRVNLQAQQFQVLAMLLETPGDVVSREALKQKLWATNTFVDFDRGLNRAVNRLREALGDEADNPRFIETLSRRGYRFIAPVTKRGAGIEDIVRPDGQDPRHSVPEVSLDAKVDEGGRKARSKDLPLWPWVIAACLTLVALLAYWKPWLARQRTSEKPFLQLDLNVEPDEFSTPAISSDGTRVAFVSQHALAIRRFDQAKSTRLAGTEGAFLPFFSPSGKWLAFFRHDRLLKVAVEGGAPIDLCTAPNAAGGTWVDEDHIVASLDGAHQGLSRISAAGGKPELLTDVRSRTHGSLTHVWPQALPEGKGILFAATDGSGLSSLQILTFRDGKIKKVVEGPSHGRLIAGGFLIYFQNGTLFGVQVDPQRLELAGPAVPLIYGVANPGGFGRAEFDASDSGTLVYRGGSEGTSFIPAWIYPSGKTERVFPESGHFLTPRLSPDGKRLAIALVEEGKQKIWVYNLRRQTWIRVTSDSETELLPTWTPDGEFLAFRSGRGLAWARSDGSGTVQRLIGTSPNAGPWSFSSDGKWLAFWPLEPDSDLWSVPVRKDSGELRVANPQILLQQAKSSKGAPAISPNDRWVAYSSNESGRFEIYVAPFLPTGRSGERKWPVSNNGGLSPIWSANGLELFFQSIDHHVEVVSYSTKGDSFVAGLPRSWGRTPLGGTGIFQAFDVAPDGKRLLALLDPGPAEAGMALHVFLNVDDELRRRTSGRSK